MPRAAMPASRKTSSISPRPQPRSSTGACSRKRAAYICWRSRMSSSDPRNRSANLQPVDIRKLAAARCGRRAAPRLAAERCSLPQQPQLGVNHALRIRRGSSRSDRAQSRFWISSCWRVQRSFEIGVLRFHLLAIVRVHQRDAMLERRLQFGDAAQELDLGSRPASVPMPVRHSAQCVADVLQLARLSAQCLRLAADFARGERDMAGWIRSALRASPARRPSRARLNSTCSRTCQSSARATIRFTRWAMEFFSPGGARIHGADAGHLRFGGVARVQQRRQIGQRNVVRPPRRWDGARERAAGFPRSPRSVLHPLRPCFLRLPASLLQLAVILRGDAAARRELADHASPRPAGTPSPRRRRNRFTTFS